MPVLSLLLSLAQLIVVAGVLYYCFLILASIPVPRLVLPKEPAKQCRFAILVPAHNEATVIADTIHNLGMMDYPGELFDVIVVADHCDDDTVVVARSAGAICYERNDGERGRKGFALSWLVDRVISSSGEYDALIIMDADSRPNSKFLTVMNQALATGSQAIQGQHMISDHVLSTYNKLAAIDMRLNNRLRNRAKHNMGLSCRLMGDAMCFSTDLLRTQKWNTFSLAEDMEFGTRLLLNGTRVIYAQDAISYGQAAGGWQRASKQRLRWSGGFLDLRRRLGFEVFRSGIIRLDSALIDRGIELLLPAYSTLVITTIVVLLMQLLFPGVTTLFSPLFIALTVGTWFMLPLLGLILDGAPRNLTLAYFVGPIFVAWRLWIGAQTFIRGKRIEWVRTPRREEL